MATCFLRSLSVGDLFHLPNDRELFQISRCDRSRRGFYVYSFSRRQVSVIPWSFDLVVIPLPLFGD